MDHVTNNDIQQIKLKEVNAKFKIWNLNDLKSILNSLVLYLVHVPCIRMATLARDSRDDRHLVQFFVSI